MVTYHLCWCWRITLPKRGCGTWNLQTGDGGWKKRKQARCDLPVLLMLRPSLLAGAWPWMAVVAPSHCRCTTCHCCPSWHHAPLPIASPLCCVGEGEGVGAWAWARMPVVVLSHCECTTCHCCPLWCCMLPPI